MSGIGSGTSYRINTKTLVENCSSISVDRWKREGLLAVGGRFTWVWKDRYDADERSISVSIFSDLLELTYMINSTSYNLEKIRTQISIVHSSCNYGGEETVVSMPKVWSARREAIS